MNSLITSALSMGSETAQLIFEAAIRLGLSRDDIYTVLTKNKDDFINAILLNLNEDVVLRAKINVVTDKMNALMMRLKNEHHVQLSVIDRKLIQGRDWQTDMANGAVHNLYVAKDIVDEGNVMAFDRIAAAIVPFFFGERNANFVAAEEVVDTKTVAPTDIPETHEPVVTVPAEPVEKETVSAVDEVKEQAVTNIIKEAVQNSVLKFSEPETEVSEAPKTETATTSVSLGRRRRPAIKTVK